MHSAPEIISSPQNPKIKNLKKLEKASERKDQGLFVIEGLREAVLAQRSGYEIVSVFVCEEFLKQDATNSFKEITSKSKAQIFSITKAVYESLAYRESTEGVIAVAKPKPHSLTDLNLKAASLLLVIEGVEKPGNLGAMLRTCDAAAVDAVIICDAKTDVYNANVIRASIGTIFTNQIAVCESADAIKFLKENGIKIFAATPDGKKLHFQQKFKDATAIVVGTEADGLSNTWLNAADEKIKIPMLGKIDSLNVSVSAAVLLFEALRQRTV